MSISFTDDMLKEAVIKADIYEIEALPTDDEIEHEFSNEFKRKMKRLVRKSKTRNPVGGMAFFSKACGRFCCSNNYPVCVRNERISRACCSI